MPPIRRPLREIPRAENPRQAWIIDGTDVVLGPMVASRAGEDAPVAKTKEAIAGAGFRLAPLTALVSIVHSTIKGWFTRMDTALEVLPAGLGPIVASLVRLVSMMTLAVIAVRVASIVAKLPSRASKLKVEGSTDRLLLEDWLRRGLDCTSNVFPLIPVEDRRLHGRGGGAGGTICGSYAHLGCSRWASRAGLACKALCRTEMERTHRRIFEPLEEDELGDGGAAEADDAAGKTPPVMRHQWIRCSIDGSQPCAGCGLSMGHGLPGFACPWCKMQVHEECLGRVSDAVCNLGRHRRLILPPTAVVRHRPPRKAKVGLIRDAVNKVCRVLPRSREDEMFEAFFASNGTPEGIVGARNWESRAASLSGQSQRFVDAVRDVAATSEVDVGKVAAEGSRRLAEAVLDTIPMETLGDEFSPGEESLGFEDLSLGSVGSIDDMWEMGMGDESLNGTTAPGKGFHIDDERAVAVAAAAAAAVTRGGVSSGGVRGPGGEDGGGSRSASGCPGARSGVSNAVCDGLWEKALAGAALSTTAATSVGAAGDESSDRGGPSERSLAGGEELKSRLRSRTPRVVVVRDYLRLTRGSDASVQRLERVVSYCPRPTDLRLIPPEKPENDAESVSENGAGTSRNTATARRSRPRDLPSFVAEKPSVPTTTPAMSLGAASDARLVGEDRPSGRLASPPSERNEVDPGVGSREPLASGFPERNGRSEGGERIVSRIEQVAQGRGQQEETARGAEEKGVGQEDEEVQREWSVKVQELLPRFQSSGEGSAATKSVSYVRKTRSVTYRISEDDIPEDCTPLVVFVNSKSGGKQGADLLSKFRALLNPLQVSDLSEEDPVDVLHRYRNVDGVRLLGCGGDGTVAWLLEAVDKVNWRTARPSLAVLPLGTGNDLARVLGWGGGYVGGDLDEILDAIADAKVTMLDRWSVSVACKPKGKHASFRKPQKDRRLVMNNYLGIGVDGQVALDFHNMREARPVLFSSRILNKVLYAQMGARSALARACHDLSSNIELRCDGRLIELPATTASVIAVNINSYGGGSKLWASDGSDRRARPGKGAIYPLVTDHQEDVDSETHTRWGMDTSPLERWEGSGSSSLRRGSPRGGRTGEGMSSDRPLKNHNLREGKGARRRRGRRRKENPGEVKASSRVLDSVDIADSVDNVYRGRQGERRVAAPPSHHDGLIEVVAVEGVLHLGQIQLGLSRALPVAQCRELEIRTSRALPMQVDGEPWTQAPSDITVKLQSQAALLRPSSAEEKVVDSFMRDVSEALDGAEQDLVINEHQATTLLSRIRRNMRKPSI